MQRSAPGGLTACAIAIGLCACGGPGSGEPGDDAGDLDGAVVAVDAAVDAADVPAPGSLPAGLAYRLASNTGDELWLLPIDPAADLASAVEVRLDAPAGQPGGVVQFAWSPRGKRLAMVRSGTPLQKVDLVSTTSPADSRMVATTVDQMIEWDPTGTRLLHADGQRRLWVTQLDPPATTRLSAGDVLSEFGDFYYRPRWSPDGRAVSFMEHTDFFQTSHVVTLDGANVVRDVSGLYFLGEWLPSSAAVLGWMVAGNDVAPALQCLADGSITPLPFTGGLDGVHVLASPDSRRLVWDTLDLDTDVYSLGVTTVDGCAVADGGRTSLTGTGLISRVALADGGGRAIFVQGPGNGTSQAAVLDLDPFGAPRAVSTAGSVAFSVRALPGDSRILWTEHPMGFVPARLMLSGPGAAGGAMIASDVGDPQQGLDPAPVGHLVYYASRSGADVGLAVIAVDGSRARQSIFSGMVHSVRWSPRGDALFFGVSATGQRMVAVDNGTRFGTPRVVAPGRLLFDQRWSP